MKVIIDDVEVYVSSKSRKWPDSITISRPEEKGRHISIPKENIPKVIEALNMILGKEFSYKFIKKDGSRHEIDSSELKEIIMKETFALKKVKGQKSFKVVKKKGKKVGVELV